MKYWKLVFDVMSQEVRKIKLIFKEGNRVEQKASDRDIMHMLFLSKIHWKYDNDT